MDTNITTLADALNLLRPEQPLRSAAIAFIYRALRRLMARLRTSAANAEDAVQIVAANLLRRGLEPRPRTERQAQRLLFRMLRNAAVGQWRRDGRDEPVEDIEVLAAVRVNPERLAAARQELAYVGQAVERLLAGDPRTLPRDRARLARRLDRGLRARGFALGEGPLPSGRSSAEAKAEQRAVARRTQVPDLPGDGVGQAVRALLGSMRDLRGWHGESALEVACAG